MVPDRFCPGFFCKHYETKLKGWLNCYDIKSIMEWNNGKTALPEGRLLDTVVGVGYIRSGLCRGLGGQMVKC